MIQKWEYDILYVSQEETVEEILVQLDALGQSGWEHYAISGSFYFLKRPLLPVNALGDEQELNNVESVELPEGYWR